MAPSEKPTTDDPGDEARDGGKGEQEVGVEAGVVEEGAQRLAVAGPAHVHAHDVPPPGAGQPPGGDDVGGSVRAPEAVDDHEGRPALARPGLPARPQQQADPLAGLHDEVLGGAIPAQVPAHPVTENGLAVTAREPRGRVKSGGRDRWAQAFSSE